MCPAEVAAQFVLSRLVACGVEAHDFDGLAVAAVRALRDVPYDNQAVSVASNTLDLSNSAQSSDDTGV